LISPFAVCACIAEDLPPAGPPLEIPAALINHVKAWVDVEEEEQGQEEQVQQQQQQQGQEEQEVPATSAAAAGEAMAVLAFLQYT
jgi:hypothetical protein